MKSTRKNTTAPQAIVTKYIPATNTRPSYVKASCERGSITLPWEDAFNTEANHYAAVDALIARFVAEDRAKHGTTKRNPWARGYVLGALPARCGGYVAVLVG